MDSALLGYKTHIVYDAVRGIVQSSVAEMNKRMHGAGINFVDSASLVATKSIRGMNSPFTLLNIDQKVIHRGEL